LRPIFSTSSSVRALPSSMNVQTARSVATGPSSHRRLHWPSVACACAASAKEESPIRLLIPSPLTRPTVFTPRARPAVFTPLALPTVFTLSTPLAVGVLRVRRASCATHRLHTVDSTVRRRPARAPRLLRAPPSSHRRLHWLSASCACAAPTR